MAKRDGTEKSDPRARGTRVASVASSKQPFVKENRAFKLIVIGSSNVGKTCLACLFADGVCPRSTETTIGVDFREKKVVVEKEIIKLQLWDTAGQERFRQSMTSRYYRDAHAMIIVYDITNSESFRQCQFWLDEAQRLTDTGVRVLALVGNKSDDAENRAVSTRMGQKFAEANRMLFFETSTQTEHAKDNVKQIFFTIAARLTEHRTSLEESVCVRQDDMVFSLLPDTVKRVDFIRSSSVATNASASPSLPPNGTAGNAGSGGSGMADSDNSLTFSQLDRVITGSDDQTGRRNDNKPCCSTG